MDRILKRGEGWRVGWDPAAGVYRGLLGGEDWAIELTEEEWSDFRRLCQQLKDTMEGMTEELMAEERVTCEAESELLWLEAEGFPGRYSLRLLLYRGRRCEGNWSAEAVRELSRAIEIWP